MVRRRHRQRSLWEVVLPEVATLWPASLRRIDALLEDEAVLEPGAQALEARWPQSRRRGRPGTPAEVVLRMLVLKHLYRWSYDELEREVRANLVYRGFARIGDAPGPDAKTILKIAQTLGPEVIQALQRRVVALAIGAGVVKGRRLRIDTTVVETPIHYPTDSTLLRDSVRVLTRTLQRVGTILGGPAARVRNRLRSVGRHCLAIAQAVRRLAQCVRTAPPAVRRTLQRARQTLETMRPLTRRVLAQTGARVLGGDTHVPHKVLSVFEPHTEAIRKGKVVKPTEFGKMVTIQEAEPQIITGYDVHAERPADATLWAPALDRHQ